MEINRRQHKKTSNIKLCSKKARNQSGKRSHTAAGRDAGIDNVQYRGGAFHITGGVVFCGHVASYKAGCLRVGLLPMDEIKTDVYYPYVGDDFFQLLHTKQYV